MTEYNKVVYDGQTLIDLTQDDVTASDVRSGVYFHSADGVRGQGTLTSTSVPTANTIAEWDNDVHMNSEDMTSQEVDDFVDSLNVSGTSILDMFYPVGSYYETSDTTFDPNVRWGGTWVQETAGQVHVSAGTGYTVAGALTNTTDGGASTVTLQASQIPAHNHKIPANVFRYINRTPTLCAKGTNGLKAYSEDSGQYTDNNTGGGGAHNNMQPYIVVNRWHRTA